LFKLKKILWSPHIIWSNKIKGFVSCRDLGVCLLVLGDGKMIRIMIYKNFLENRNAVAGVIEAFLLVALVAIVLSTIQLAYIPQVMEQREADHMDDVSNQFSYLKSVIDIQSITESEAPMVSQLTLGSKELPYFITARAFGSLTIPSEGFRIVVEADSSGNISLKSIKYEAYNSYFVDQTYVLEGGSIIVKQSTGASVMIVDPSISVANETKIILRFYMPNILDIPGKNSTYGYRKCFIRTNYSSPPQYYNYTNVESIKIYTEYTNAWNESLHNLLGDVVNISKQPVESPTYVEITPNGAIGKIVDLQIKIMNIHAQISPGWIK